jgi:NAD-dependent deacetylase
LERASVDLDAFRANPTRQTVPRCPSCGSFLRQHVLWFDEYYQSHEDYQWNRVMEAVADCELLLFVGTSFSVGVTDHALSEARGRGVPVFNLDPSGQAIRGVELIAEPSEVALPELAAALS